MARQLKTRLKSSKTKIKGNNMMNSERMDEKERRETEFTDGYKDLATQ